VTFPIDRESARVLVFVPSAEPLKIEGNTVTAGGTYVSTIRPSVKITSPAHQHSILSGKVTLTFQTNLPSNDQAISFVVKCGDRVLYNGKPVNHLEVDLRKLPSGNTPIDVILTTNQGTDRSNINLFNIRDESDVVYSQNAAELMKWTGDSKVSADGEYTRFITPTKEWSEQTGSSFKIDFSKRPCLVFNAKNSTVSFAVKIEIPGKGFKYFAAYGNCVGDTVVDIVNGLQIMSTPKPCSHLFELPQGPVQSSISISPTEGIGNGVSLKFLKIVNTTP